MSIAKKRLALWIANAVCALGVTAALVDTDGNAVTNETALGDIDMAVSTYGDLKDGIAPDYSNVSNKAMSAASTNDVVLHLVPGAYTGYRLGDADGVNTNILLAPAGNYAYRDEIPDINGYKARKVWADNDAYIHNATGELFIVTISNSFWYSGTSKLPYRDSRGNDDQQTLRHYWGDAWRYLEYNPYNGLVRKNDSDIYGNHWTTWGTQPLGIDPREEGASFTNMQVGTYLWHFSSKTMTPGGAPYDRFATTNELAAYVPPDYSNVSNAAMTAGDTFVHKSGETGLTGNFETSGTIWANVFKAGGEIRQTEYKMEGIKYADAYTLNFPSKSGTFALSNDLATVAYSGSYNDLSNKPTIPAAQVNSDWNANSGVAQILNKPTNVSAFSNDSGYVTKTVTNGLLSATTAANTYLPKSDVVLAVNAATGKAADSLETKTRTTLTESITPMSVSPSLPAEVGQPSWWGESQWEYYYGDIVGMPEEYWPRPFTYGWISLFQYTPEGTPDTIRWTGGENDVNIYMTLDGTQYIGSRHKQIVLGDWTSMPLAPAEVYDVKQDKLPYATNAIPWGAVSGKPNFATVATSGSYNDLSNKPTIPAAQVQTDWNATSGMGVLLNKPTLATVATSGSYNDLSNKPTKLSQFTNDSGFITGYTETDPTVGLTNSTIYVHGKSTNVVVRVTNNSVDLGIRKSGTTFGNYSVAEGTNTTASSQFSHAEGYDTKAQGSYSHAEGASTTTSAGYAHAEGQNTTASNTAAHSEGSYTVASGQYSHAEGQSTTASGDYSHAEGEDATACGHHSHADGYRSVTAQTGHGNSATGPHRAAYAWQGQSGTTTRDYYHSHGDGTFNINPIPKSGETDPATGFYIGETNLVDHIKNNVPAETDPTIGLTNGVLTVHSTQANLITSNAYGSVALGASQVYPDASASNSVAYGISSVAVGYNNFVGGRMAIDARMIGWTMNVYHDTWVWNSSPNAYSTHGDGTFNINPIGGTDGFYIGESNLTQHIAASVAGLAAETNITFSVSNDVFSVSTNGTVVWASDQASSGSSKNIAMFIIPMNTEPTNVVGNAFYREFELKASTNNFALGTSDAVKLQFYGQSSVANTGYGDSVDKMKMYVVSGVSNIILDTHDQRAYAYLRNTQDAIPVGGGPEIRYDRIVVIVDTSCLKRNPDGGWLTEGNEDLMWCYSRGMYGTSEKEPHTENKQHWHPIAPVRWFKKLPNWAVTH